MGRREYGFEDMMDSTVESSRTWWVESIKTFSMGVMAWKAFLVVKSKAPDQEEGRGQLKYTERGSVRE